MDIKKRLMAIALAGAISTSLVGCKKEEKGLNLHEDFLKHYETYRKQDIVGNSVVNKYRCSNIVIGINKETNEVDEFIYYAGDAKNYLYEGIDKASLMNNLGFIVELYDLETGKLIYLNSEKNIDFNVGGDNLNKLLEQYDFYNIYNLYDLGIEYKEYYTLEEIRDIAKLVIDKNTKIKKLTNK